MNKYFMSLAVVLGLTTPAMAKFDIIISKTHQSMTVYEDGNLVDVWFVSTARRGYYTPSGTFHPYSYQPMHYSKKFDNAPMPNSIFFSGGYAIHATPHTANLGRPASHGCVRLHPTHAAELYTMTKGQPTTIRITE
jgi:lipoprotein-anchoring transpeptidase ErfK/SrfK